MNALNIDYTDSAGNQPWGSMYNGNNKPVVNTRFDSKKYHAQCTGYGIKRCPVSAWRI